MAMRVPRVGDRARVGSLAACPSPDAPDLPGLPRHDEGEEGWTGTVLRDGAQFTPIHPFQVGFDAAGGAAGAGTVTRQSGEAPECSRCTVVTVEKLC